MENKEKGKETAAVVTQEVKQEADKVAGAVNAWFFEHIHNTIASRDTEIYNHLQQAKEELVKKVKEALA